MAIIIVSGGQTGVDRAALDAALDNNMPCGGWCPTGRKAEDGSIPLSYPLTELKGTYKARTIKNVQDSDCTIIIYFGKLSGGTGLTHKTCLTENKPVLLIDVMQNNIAKAEAKIYEFVIEHNCKTVNFAGPRASMEPQANDYTYLAVSGFINLMKGKKTTESTRHLSFHD